MNWKFTYKGNATLRIKFSSLKKNEVKLHKQDIINVENQSYILIFF
jgi:hypothetical protein